jgi:AAA+ superfamily predicted ATPase
VDLYVDYISAVKWNKQAFIDLVVDDEAKELVQALVMKQLAAEESTDFIAGKGNGLIVLLHGGPGTGKTFTAEGVAEFAEKPLLRVTCGDVGTVAEVVEKKLQSSFHLGKIWDCGMSPLKAKKDNDSLTWL